MNKKYEQCKACKGTGKGYDECETCGTDGWVDDERDGGTMECPDCHGESAVDCDECEGTGEELAASDDGDNESKEPTP